MKTNNFRSPRSDGRGCSVEQLVGVLMRLLDDDGPPALPDWTYLRWCRALEYRDLSDRARATTKELGRERDRLLGDPRVAALIEWTGRRRRDNPSAAGAAALVMVRLAQESTARGPVDVAGLAIRITGAADRVHGPWRYPSRWTRLLADLDRLEPLEADEPPVENPRLVEVVGRLLIEADVEADSELRWRVEASVIQAGDWWARHATPIPTALGGPRLPGVVPAQSLHETHRLSAYLSDSAMLDLVAGPQPGRSRPCQVAWRRGLTFWTAVRLSAEGAGQRPPREALDWWQSRLRRPLRGPAVIQPSPKVARAS